MYLQQCFLQLFSERKFGRRLALLLCLRSLLLVVDRGLGAPLVAARRDVVAVEVPHLAQQPRVHPRGSQQSGVVSVERCV